MLRLGFLDLVVTLYSIALIFSLISVAIGFNEARRAQAATLFASVLVGSVVFASVGWWLTGLSLNHDQTLHVDTLRTRMTILFPLGAAILARFGIPKMLGQPERFYKSALTAGLTIGLALVVLTFTLHVEDFASMWRVDLLYGQPREVPF